MESYKLEVVSLRRCLHASISLSLVCLVLAACTGSTPSRLYPAPILTMETETLPLPSDLTVNRAETLEPFDSPTASPTFFLTPNPNNTLVGAIRWDAWVGDYAGTEEIALHLQEALAWIEANPEAAPANAVIMYAWNEFDEGGWLCPTLSEGTARLDAIRKILIGE